MGLLQIGAWMDATVRGRRALGARADLRGAIDEELPREDFYRLSRRRLVASLDGLTACVDLVLLDRYR